MARIDIVFRSCVPDEQAVKSGCRSEAATHVVEFQSLDTAAGVAEPSLANRGGCTGCIGMYWDVFWMYQIFFGCMNIMMCIGMYFRGIMMYSTMYCDVLTDVLRCIPLPLMNPNTSPNLSLYISEYITIHLVIHPSTYDVLECISLSIHDQYTEINIANTSPIHIVGQTEVWGTTANTSIIHESPLRGYSNDTSQIHS